MKLVIFDLDHTLMPMDTGDVWVRFLVAKGARDPEPIFSELERFAREYKEQTLDINDFMGFQMRFLASFRRADLDRYLQEYLDLCVRPNIPEASRKLVDAHLKAGDTVALCTATYDYVTAPIAGLFGISTVLAAHPGQTPGGEFDGTLDGIPSYREGKVRFVEEFVRKQMQDFGRDYNEFVFYSDSINDMALFDFVAQKNGICVAANPGKDLRAVAEKLEWPVTETFDQFDLDRAKRPAVDLSRQQ